MKIRPNLVPETEQNNFEVIQLTDESVPSSHIYMEAQIFTPDSQRLILHRSAHPHGSDPKDPEHQFLICGLEGPLQFNADHHRTRNHGTIHLTRRRMAILLRQ